MTIPARVFISFNISYYLMKIIFHCPGCETTRRTEFSEEQETVQCDQCQWSRPLASSSIEKGTPICCLICGCTDLWRQKDFPVSLGIMLVALGASLSTIAWWFYYPMLAIGILMCFALLDLLLFSFMKDILVCYHCAARHSGEESQQSKFDFDHETAEKYRQEAIQLKQSS